jgi:signal transduction histidine kinase
MADAVTVRTGLSATCSHALVQRRYGLWYRVSTQQPAYPADMGNQPTRPGETVTLWQRALVPGEWYESGGARSASDWGIDLALFIGASAIGALILAHIWPNRSEPVNWLDLVSGSAACLALWVRRSRPLVVLLFAMAGVFSALAAGAALIAVFNAAVRGRGRTLSAAAVLAVAASVTFPLLNPAAGPIFRQRFPGFMMMAIAFGWGLFVRERRQLVISLRERTERLQADQQRSVELARDAERRRISREMHDVLAHRLSLLSIHAGALELRPDAPAAEIEAAAVIRNSAAAALVELRQVIAVLREDATAGTAAPQPTLNQLPDLLDESRAAGMNLHANIDLRGAETLPAARGRAAYRVVQEGLTNARKHAPGATVDLNVVDGGRDGLLIEVLSHPCHVAMEAHATPAATPGSGLIGLSERLALMGGDLVHAPMADGGFLLRATIPAEP